MIARINISAGELFELIRPAVLILSALISAWVFANARKHFSFAVALLWALASFFLTAIVVPIYLVVLLLRRSTPSNHIRRKLIVPLAYGLVLISVVLLFLSSQNRGVDVHLARAEYAKLRGNHHQAIAEYRAALSQEDNPHTRKLLGVELFESKQWRDALSELRRAEQEGEHDDLVILRIGSLLDALGQPNQARLEYQRFLESPRCLQAVPDRRCETARGLLAKKVE